MVASIDSVTRGKWVDVNGNGLPDLGEKLQFSFALLNSGRRNADRRRCWRYRDQFRQHPILQRAS